VVLVVGEAAGEVVQAEEGKKQEAEEERNDRARGGKWRG
jgi:hypothetical protein